jgi:hypothetical protein
MLDFTPIFLSGGAEINLFRSARLSLRAWCVTVSNEPPRCLRKRCDRMS